MLTIWLRQATSGSNDRADDRPSLYAARPGLWRRNSAWRARSWPAKSTGRRASRVVMIRARTRLELVA